MVINIDGVDINYEVMGEGKPVLILHGWGASINAMAPIWSFFKDKYKIYVIDFPGESGQSTLPPEPWGVPEYGEMVKKFLEELKVEKPSVIGHSFGGRVIIYLASKYQNLFDKIVLTDAAGVKPKMTFHKYKNMILYKAGKWCIKTFLPKEMSEKKLKELSEKHSSPDYKALKSEVMKESFKKIVAQDFTHELRRIKRPTLLVWGEKDIDTPLYMAKIMADRINDCGLVVLKDAKHFSYIDKSYEYNLIVDNFLGGK